MSGCAARGVSVPVCAILAGPVVVQGRDIVNTELITLVVGILTLAGGQIAAVLVLVGRMDRQTDQMNQRFDGFNENVNRRFDGVNQRFDGVHESVNQRFDGVNQRFDDINESVNRRFDGVHESVNQRFDGMSREFTDLRERMVRLEGALEGFIAGRRDRDVA